MKSGDRRWSCRFRLKIFHYELAVVPQTRCRCVGLGEAAVTGLARSGPTPESRACLAKINEKGTRTVSVGGKTRTWLEDGDEISFRAKAERDGYASIGFGACRGKVLPCFASGGR